MGVVDECAFVGCDGVRSDAVHPIEGDTEGDAARNVWGAGFEFVRKVVVGGPVEGHAADHFTATPPRGHGVEQGLPAPEEADAGWPVGLVAGGHVEVAPDGGDVDVEVGQGLRSVDQGDRASGPRCGTEFGDWVDGAERVRGVNDAHELGLVLLECPREIVEVQRTVFKDVDRNDLGPLFLADHLPGNDVGVVFHPGHQHGITGL